MTVIFATSDLMSASQLRGAAERAGLSASVAGTPESLEDAIGDPVAGPVTLVVVDLAARAFDVASVIARARRCRNPPAVVAYGPHVGHDRLEAARIAGCREVFSRGQFFSRAELILTRLASAPAVDENA